jgi:hypothetical protein
MSPNTTAIANQLTRTYVVGCDTLMELVLKQRQHGYIPTIRSDYGTKADRLNRATLAQAYDSLATELGLEPCFSNYSRSARAEIIKS